MSVATNDIEMLQAALRAGRRVLPRGAGTKPALSTAPERFEALDLSALSGIIEYDPAELTFTALAGTPVAEVSHALAKNGQYLPFDPPYAAAGATLGGVVATGASGANAFRHGGVRDFIIGVRFLDGTGRLLSGGGKVVKNAAGFELPKLMVGSMGRLGVLVQLSFKVFPRPQSSTTLRVRLDGLDAALTAIAQLGRGPLDLDALDLEPPGTLVIRLAGASGTLPARAARLAILLGARVEQLDGAADADEWHRAAELAWAPQDSTLVRVALSLRAVPSLQRAAADAGAAVRYSLGGNVAWVAWPVDRPLGDLDAALRALQLAGMVLRGTATRPLLGHVTGGAFATRLRAVLDPHSHFPEA